MVLLLKHSKEVIFIFSNRPYVEIATDSIRRYDSQQSGAWVYIGMTMCRVGKAAARRNGGMVADQVAQWRTRWQGGTVVHQVARWCHSGSVVSRCRTRSHGNTVAACWLQMAQWNGVADGKV